MTLTCNSKLLVGLILPLFILKQKECINQKVELLVFMCVIMMIIRPG